MADVSREQMRAADDDRKQVADQLRLALEEGRLDLAEYDERLQGAYAAKTYAELDRLLTDLPNAAPLVPAQPAEVAVQVPDDGVRQAWLAHVWGSWAKAAAFFTLIWGISSLASNEAVFYWPAWVIGPWGVVLLVRTVAGLASGEPRKHAEEAEHRRRLREHKRDRKALYAQAIAAGELPENPSKEQRKAFIAEAVARGDLPPKPRRGQ
ncbi:DUF1707 domain-containing protein [Actinoplanes sp. Pm04-4]|uniref:DUF1707 domain-containing protein n=2 Tax=Paractinoplanes pyxinae TaxID=2997416 RepID=A0ABT4AVF8_9ACTN|nr:DUF1707 domain-containing protein [Actinoplanes pyxinae]MCY1137832.1 DUF1707 domain-containing protein [Actinoplanes pyxinae]